MYSPYKKLTAQLLLFSFLLESCYNPNIGASKRIPPTPKGVAYQQHQYKENTYSKHLEPLTNLACITADGHAITFTHHNQVWQAEVCMPNGRRQLPVTFEPGYTIEDLADKDPTEQQQLIHICPNKDPINHIYVGKTETYEQYISKIETKKHPQPAETNTQEQAALRALPSPVQTIPASPNSQSQPQANSKPLPIPSSELFGYNNACNTYNNAHKTSNKRIPSLKNQHALAHSQRAAQNERAERTARTKPLDEPAPTAHLKQNTPPTTLQLPSPAANTPQDIVNPIFVAQGGQCVHLMHKNDQWQASVREQIGAFSRVEMLPVFCERHGDIAAALLALQGEPDKYVQQRIHVMTARQIPYMPKFVFIGEQALKGGGDAGPSGSGEPPTRGHAGATDSRARPPSLAAVGRSASMALQERMAQEDITSTEDLVKALNAAQTAEERQVLQEWVRAYIEWFKRQEVSALTPGDMQEYSSLAYIKANTEGNKELLKIYFNKLCNEIDREYKHGEEYLIQALEYTLQTLDSRFFEGNPHSLIQLGNKLLAKLNPSNHFSKETYPTHRSLLYALHQVLVLIREIASSQWNPSQKDGLYSQFRARIQAIAESAQYYPVCYHARLLEQSLQRLASAGNRARLQDGLRRAGHGLEGAAYLYKGVRSLATLDFDIESFVSGYESIQAAFDSRLIAEKPWYDCLQSMNHACLLSLADAEQYQVFAECLQMLKANEISMFKAEDRTALRYGLVQQLSLLALAGATARVRKASMEELLSLSTLWLADVEVMEELLDRLATIAVESQGEEREAAEKALANLSDTPILASSGFWSMDTVLRKSAKCRVSVQRAIEAWRGVEEKLKSMPVPSGPVLGGLFSAINKELRGGASEEIQAAATVQELREGLRAYYRQVNFAHIRSIFDEDAPKSVEKLQCQLQLLEQVKEKEGPREDDEWRAPGGRQDQLYTHHERLQQVKTPIGLEDIFKCRSTKPDEPEREIDKVLLVGEAGTGKTTLSKKLAYSWAQGSWGQAFEAVYVLPVRALQESQYDNLHFRREATLATAIVNNCFLPSEEESYKSLRRQVSEELEKSTTLVVLDGLDERYGSSEQLLNQAKGGKHKLLMLSRPYGIEAERPLVDIEIEHAGFNDAQMEAYVSDELSGSPELGQELLAFIREQPTIGAIAHVPVNLQILCRLWQDDGSGVRGETRNGSLPGLYGRLTGYIWQRYKEKHRVQDEDQESLFSSLGQIAVRGLERGEVLLSQGLVEGVLEEGDGRVRAMLKDTGFLLLQDLGRQYQFPHLTFQEYFAGRWLAKQFLSVDTRERGRVKEFFMNHKYEGKYGVTFSFMAGELSKRGGVEGIRQMLELVDEDPREVVGVQHVLLQVRLLHEFLSMSGDDLEADSFMAGELSKRGGVEGIRQMSELVDEDPLQVRLLHEFLSVSGDDLEADLAELEGRFQVLESLKGWFGEGLDRVRRGGYSGDASKLLELLTSGLQGSRAVAAHAPDLREGLLNALSDDDRSVRHAAVWALVKLVAAIPAEAPDLREGLLNALSDDDRNVRRAAVWALGELVVAIPAETADLREGLLNALSDDDRSVRRAAVRALGQVVAAASAEVPGLREVLLNALKDDDRSVCRAAVWALGQVVAAAPAEVPDLREGLLNAAQDGNRNIRSAAFEALEKLVAAIPTEAADLREILLNALSDNDRNIRSAAVESLRKLVAAIPGEAADLREGLLNAAQDGNRNIRRDAVWALGELVTVIPAEAVDLREDLLKALKDSESWVRRAAIEALKKFVKAVPAEAPGLVEPLLNACKDVDYSVRRATVWALEELVAVIPAEAPVLREGLLNALKDDDRRVRRDAVWALEKFVKAVPAEVPGLVEPLLNACKDIDYSVRSATVEALGALVKAAPGEAANLREDLLKAAQDGNSNIRSAAVWALGQVAEAAPGEAADLREDLLKAAQDGNNNIRSAAIWALGQVAEAAPGEAADLREVLLKAAQDRNSNIRRAAFEALVKLVAAIPAEAPDLREILLNALKNDDWSVRSDAVEALVKLVAAVPAEAPDLREILLKALKDSESWVRSAAVWALGQVAEAVPADAPGLREVLVNALKDDDRSVRHAAVEALGQVVAAIPAEAPGLLEHLPKALKYDDRNVRSAARKVLEKFSIQQLINSYWATKNQAFISPIVARLYHMPLTVRATPGKLAHQRLVLYSTAGQSVTWDKPREEVAHFVELIKREVKKGTSVRNSLCIIQ